MTTITVAAGEGGGEDDAGGGGSVPITPFVLKRTNCLVGGEG